VRDKKLHHKEKNCVRWNILGTNIITYSQSGLRRLCGKEKSSNAHSFKLCAHAFHFPPLAKRKSLGCSRVQSQVLSKRKLKRMPILQKGSTPYDVKFEHMCLQRTTRSASDCLRLSQQSLLQQLLTRRKKAKNSTSYDALIERQI